MTFAFQPFKIVSSFHFETILIQSLCVLGFQSTISGLLGVYPTLVRHRQTSKGLNESMIILSNLELPALPYVAPITAISGSLNINYITCIKLSGGLVGR